MDEYLKLYKGDREIERCHGEVPRRPILNTMLCADTCAEQEPNSKICDAGTHVSRASPHVQSTHLLLILGTVGANTECAKNKEHTLIDSLVFLFLLLARPHPPTHPTYPHACTHAHPPPLNRLPFPPYSPPESTSTSSVILEPTEAPSPAPAGTVPAKDAEGRAKLALPAPSANGLPAGPAAPLLLGPAPGI